MGPVEDSLLVSQTEMIQELSYQRHLLWNNWLNESGENSGVFQGSSKVYCWKYGFDLKPPFFIGLSHKQ